MSVVIPNEGEVRFLTIALKDASLGSTTYTFRLYSNSVTVDKTVTSASFTEVVGGGYAAVSLNRLQWVVSQDSSSPPAIDTSATYLELSNELTFIFTDTRTVNGFYITENVSGDVMMAKSSGAIIVTAGETLKVPLQFSLE